MLFQIYALGVRFRIATDVWNFFMLLWTDHTYLYFGNGLLRNTLLHCLDTERRVASWYPVIPNRTRLTTLKTVHRWKGARWWTHVIGVELIAITRLRIIGGMSANADLNYPREEDQYRLSHGTTTKNQNSNYGKFNRTSIHSYPPLI